MEKIPIITTIDVEPDPFVWDIQTQPPWQGYAGTYEFLRQLRPRLVSATGSPVHFTWLFRLDPQIALARGSPTWPVANYPQYVEDFITNGDELGVHTHPWRWDEKRQIWIHDVDDQAWVDHCVRTSFEAFQTVLKRPCASFKFGGCWINDATLSLVEQLGARFDFSVAPGQEARPPLNRGNRVTNIVPSFLEVPQMPYRPSKTDLRKPDPSRKEGIWIIPLSSGEKIWARCQGPLRSIVDSILHLPSLHSLFNTALRSQIFSRVLSRLLYLLAAHRPLNLALRSQDFCRIMDQLLDSLPRPYLVFVLRSDITIRPAYLPNMQASFKYILSHRLAKRFVFATPAEAMQLLGLI